MAKWKDIPKKLSKLNPEEEKKREAAFEAALLAQLTKEAKPESTSTGQGTAATKPTPTPPPAATPTAPQAVKAAPLATPVPAEFESVYISITANGKTSTFSSLAEVPIELRQKIVNIWLATPPA